MGRSHISWRFLGSWTNGGTVNRPRRSRKSSFLRGGPGSSGTIFSSPGEKYSMNRRLHPPARYLMGHGVDHVVHADANPQRRVLFRIPGIVRPLPRIADVGIERHGHHDAVVVVKDAEPMRRGAVAAIPHPAAQRPLAENLVAVVEVVHGVKNRVLVVDVDDH